MTDPVCEFLDAIDARLDAGAQEYGNQSFVKPIAETARQILEEALDQEVGVLDRVPSDVEADGLEILEGLGGPANGRHPRMRRRASS